jgi:osmotically-inducible protein OsmY
MGSSGKIVSVSPNASMGSDMDIEKSLKDAFSKNSDFKVDGLKLDVKNAQVTLHGEVKAEEHIKRATAIAEKVKSVRGVTNEITCCNQKDSDKSESVAPRSTKEMDDVRTYPKAQGSK